MSRPVAWISIESIARLKSGGNSSRGTVPVHSKASAASKHPLYLKQLLFIPAECGFLDPPDELDRREATAYMRGWNACREAIAAATGDNS